MLTMTDAEMFAAFSVDLESFVRSTNPQVSAEMQLDPSQFAGEELWNVTYSRRKYSEGGISAAELARLQAMERTERVARMAKNMEKVMKGEMGMLEDGEDGEDEGIDPDFSIAETLEKPLYI